MKSTKILYKGIPHWISTKDLENNEVEKLFVFKDPELTTLLKTHDDMTVMIRKSDIEEKLRENAGGAGGAGYAVWGGGWGRTFGNPSMGGRYTGRGFGFGSSSQNLHGGPNLMYTYDVKPLNRMLQPDPTTQDEDMEYIHVGTLVRGKELKTNNEVEGKIVHIEEDEENNVSYYEVIDEDEGLKRRLDPTTVYVLDRNDGIENDEWYKMDIVGESFYPLLESEEFKDVKGKVERSKKIPKELKDEIIKRIDSSEYGSKYITGSVYNLKCPYDGVNLGADKDGFFVHTHRARSKSKSSVDKIPQKDIKFIKSTG
jgi:hypothetical protein